MSPQLIFAGIILVGAAGTGGWFTYRWVEAELITVRGERDAAISANRQTALRAKSLLEALSASEQVSRHRFQALEQSRKDETLFRSAFEALYEQSKAAKDWAGSIIPDDVRRLRRARAECSTDFNLPCPNSPTGPNPGAADGGQDKQQPPERKPLITERLTALQ